MSNLAKYAAVAALAVGLGVATTKPASAWDYGYFGYYNCGDGCGYGYGAFGPFPYGFFYPYGNDGYRPSHLPYYPHHFYGVYGPRTLYRHR
jgi:hypothetical protein